MLMKQKTHVQAPDGENYLSACKQAFGMARVSSRTGASTESTDVHERTLTVNMCNAGMHVLIHVSW